MKIKILWADTTSGLERTTNDFLKELGPDANIHSMQIYHQHIGGNVIYHFASILYRPVPSQIPPVPQLPADPYVSGK